MNSDIELENYCKRFGIPLVFIDSKDQLPSQHKQGAYIINLQDDTAGSGTHWCACIHEKDQYIYFDPFGLTAPSELQKWFGKKYIYNGLQIQDIKTGYCGLYCVFFLKYMYQFKHIPTHERLKKFLALWGLPKDNLRRLKIYFGDVLEDNRFDG